MNSLLHFLSPKLKGLVGLFIILKIAFLFLLPLTGDEAYFITWAQDLSLGYYDHPPMIGWVIYALSNIQDHYFVYRGFAFLVAIIISVLIYKIVADHKDNETALYIALIFFVSPLSLFFVILTNDVVLLLFGFLGFYYFLRAFDKNSIPLTIIAGIFLGLAFLSKYLSAIFLLALLSYAIFKTKKQTRLILITTSVVLLFVFENIYFNLNSCWNNIVFNLVARTAESSFSFNDVGLFFLSIFILVPPYGLYLLAKNKNKNAPAYITQSIYVSLFGFIVFLAVSSFKTIGLHWLALYIPFVYLLFSQLAKNKLPSLLAYNAIISIISSIVLIAIVTQYETLLKDHHRYNDIFTYTETETICAALPPNETIFTLSYSTNSILSQHCKNNTFHVIANQVKYGREDDKRINFSHYKQQNLWVFMTAQSDIKKITPYFKKTNSNPIKIRDNINYFLIDAKQFNFERYKKNILKPLSNKFYNWPSWLPAATCNFNDKYEFSPI